MISISINEEVNNKSELSNLLQHISTLIEEGYTSGQCPSWSLDGEEEEEEIE